MTILSAYLQGTKVRVTFTFTDNTQNPPAPIDPQTVTFGWAIGKASPTVYTYGSGNSIVKVVVGTYYVDIDTTPSDGQYRCVALGSGTGQGIGQDAFNVNAPYFQP